MPRHEPPERRPIHPYRLCHLRHIPVHPLQQPAYPLHQRRLDLWQANQRQLLAAGIPAANLTVFAECTACAGLPERRRYFSHRAEHGFTGRMLSAIGLA